MNALQVFHYNETSIEFEVINGQIYANATAMCQANGKRVNDWRGLAMTKRYLSALEAKPEFTVSLILSRKGGISAGGTTWIHEKLILKLASWLDVQFELWCDEKIQELLRTGTTSIVSPSVALEPTRKELAMMVIRAEEEKEALQHQLLIAQPKIDYVDEILNTSDCVVTTIVASEFGQSAISFNKKLKEMGIQWKVNGVWVLTSRYADKGYAQMRTHTYTDNQGKQHSTMQLVWTQRGRAFLHYTLKHHRQLQTTR